MENKGFLLAFFQQSPNDKAQIKGILSCEEDDKIVIKTSQGKKPYKGILLYDSNNLPILPKGNQYLKLLSLTSTLSQITFVYTEDFDTVAEYSQTFEE